MTIRYISKQTHCVAVYQLYWKYLCCVEQHLHLLCKKLCASSDGAALGSRCWFLSVELNLFRPF